SLVEKWDEGAAKRSIRFGVAETGKLQLEVSGDGQNVTTFTSTETLRGLLEDGEPAQISVQLTPGSPATATFYVNGVQLGDPVTDPFSSGAYHDHDSGWVVGTLAEAGRDRIEFFRVRIYGDTARENLVADWDFSAQEGGATVVPNEAGDGPLTITGGA